ncbi:MAG: hypothetical protein O7D33_06550 [Chloroflexi bacterium]|nr:hypothetical protein [Chloroflexota bacterium]
MWSTGALRTTGAGITIGALWAGAAAGTGCTSRPGVSLGSYRTNGAVVTLAGSDEERYEG